MKDLGLWHKVAAVVRTTIDTLLLKQESRVKRALERAAAPVFKKTGKPVMFRSQPPRKKAVQVQHESKDDDTELLQFLAKDMLAA